GCVIQCSEVWTKPGGKDPVGVLEYFIVGWQWFF
ncbi:unnamed protein product, partial [marine sediment metagenome]